MSYVFGITSHCWYDMTIGKNLHLFGRCMVHTLVSDFTIRQTCFVSTDSAALQDKKTIRVRHGEMKVSVAI